MLNDKITGYISKKEPWQQKILNQLRVALHEADPEITETLKWNAPYYEHNGKIAWMFCAKEWVHFAFLQGVLLDDSHGLFEPTDNKAKRTIKFEKGEKVPRRTIVKLARQAVANNLAEKKFDFKVPKPGTRVFDAPYKYESILKDNGLWAEYNARPYYQQKGYVEWIESAKQQATRDKRVKAMLRELKTGQYMPPKS